MSYFNDYVQNLETYIMFQIGARTLELTDVLTAKGRAPISLAMGAPVDMVPQYVVDELKVALDNPTIHTYSTPKGEKYFLDAVSARMKSRFNVDVCPKTEIFSLIGSKEGIANMIRELINATTDVNEQDVIMCPNPGYASYKEMIKVSGGRPYGIPLTAENNYMPDLEKVYADMMSQNIKPNKIKALIINYPSNPLGVTATTEYLQSCVDFCKKHNILLMSDNAYCEIYFDKAFKPISILECQGAKDIAVEFHSFSKPYAMTGWRLGWVCGNKEVISMFSKLKSTIDTGVFKAIQTAGAKLLASKEGDEYIANANALFKKKIEKFAKGLEELGWEDVKVPETTFYLWIKTPIKYNGNSKEFCKDMLETSGIVIVPGEAFGDNGHGWVRLSIVAGEKALEEAIERMKEDGHRFE